jgi:reactive intermediate/imine deaminase
MISKAFIVPGNPQILLSPEKGPSWQRLHDAYKKAREEIERTEADLILYYSTQWFSVLGYTFQGDPHPEWHHVDQNFHDLGTMHYRFRIDSDFAAEYAAATAATGHYTQIANYQAFPIDTGTIVAQKLLNPTNRLPAAMVSCNMYAEKAETEELGRAGLRALRKSGKKAIAVLVSNLSSRYFIKPINPNHDKISSAKDDEWNQKICELLAHGRLEDTSQVARDFAREANGDMGFKGIWWLAGLTGNSNHFRGHLQEYGPVWGAGAAVAWLSPTLVIPEPPPPKVTSGEALPLGAVAAPTARISENMPQPIPSAEEKNSRADSVSETIDAPQAPEPVGAYPHARRLGDLLFLSGVGPRKRNSKEIPGVTLDGQGGVLSYDVEVQTRAVIENVKTILAASGSSLEKVVDVQVFLTNMKKDFPIFNRVYAEYFAKIQATRTTIEVGALPTPIAVEFKVIALP